MFELFNQVLVWAPPAAAWGTFLAAVYFYLRLPPEDRDPLFRRLAGGYILFRVIYAAAVTAGQYWLWNQHEFTRLFLDPAAGNSLTDFFLPYAWGRFWANVILTVSLAFIFYVFLRALQKYQSRFFEDGELRLGMLAALVVGWPNVTVFLIFLFLAVVIVSLYRLGFMREKYTTLGAPFLVATALTLLFGWYAIEILGWGALRI